MYLAHFGLCEYPFSLTPDTAFFFDADPHRDALNVLLAGLRCGDGFMKVTAEIGLGKTLLCRQLLSSLDTHFVSAYVPDPQLSAASIRVALAEELGIAVDEAWSESRVLKLIRQRLLALAGAGRSTVLVLDEAHRLPTETLEAVRLLTNLETEKAKLLQVVLFGQPELDRRLADAQLRQLRQRIVYSCNLRPLGREATRVYLDHRTRVAGATKVLFGQRAADRIHAASGGTPRLINLLGHKALMAAYGEGQASVDARHAVRAIRDSADATGSGFWRWSWPRIAQGARRRLETVG